MEKCHEIEPKCGVVVSHHRSNKKVFFPNHLDGVDKMDTMYRIDAILPTFDNLRTAACDDDGGGVREEEQEEKKNSILFYIDSSFSQA